MTAPLHLLRRCPPHVNGERVDFETFRRLVRLWGRHPQTLFGSWTARRPRRLWGEVEGSSVYFVVGKEIRFRMPLVRVETVADFDPAVPVEEKFRDHVSLTCECRIVMVAPRPVGFLRGWRYLADKDAPPDLVMPAAGDPPPEMARELREMGLG